MPHDVSWPAEDPTEVQLHAGDAVGARRARNEAVRVAAATGRTRLLAEALTALDAPTLWLLREYDEVELAIVHQLRATLEALPKEDDALRCRLLATLAWESYDGAEDPEAEDLSAEAVGIARRLNEPVLLAFALNSRVPAVNRPGRFDEQVTIASELLTIAERHGLASYALLGHQMLASAFVRRFDIAAADEHALRAERLLQRMRLGIPILQQRSFESARLILDGRFSEADDKLAEIDALPIQWWAADAMRTVQRGMLLYRSELGGHFRDLGHHRSGTSIARAGSPRPASGCTCGRRCHPHRSEPSMGQDSPGLVVDHMHARPGRRRHRRRRSRGRPARLRRTPSVPRRDSDQQR